MIGILAAIAAPSWTQFLNRQRLNTAQNQVYRAMQEAKSTAKKEKVTWQASFRENLVNGKSVVQWSVHRASQSPATAIWQNLPIGVRLDQETTLLQSDGVRLIRFNDYGSTVSQLGRLTLSNQSGGKAKRCVFVSTLLGALRTAKENPKPQDGKYCY